MSKINFVPKRAQQFNGTEYPERWVCNIPKNHIENKKCRDDSPDYRTVDLTCFCSECITFDEEKYELGLPISVSKSFEEEYMVEHYFGIWIREQSND